MTAAQLSDFLSETDLAALYRPTGEARGLPGRCYGTGFYALEQRNLFPKLWCAVAFASDLPEPGDMVPVELAGRPLVVVRGSDGTVRTFHNICRHRAMRVVTEPCRGRTAMTCPWHAWSYDLEGRLLGTPTIGGGRRATDPAIDTSGLDLREVATAQWLDIVFVNLDGAAPPFEQHIKPLNQLLEDYDFSGLVYSGQEWGCEYPGNWKVAVEGAIEDYHLPFGHPQIVQGAREMHSRLDWADRVYYANSSARAYRDKEKDGGPVTGFRSPFPRLLDPEAEQRTFFMSIFPTGCLQTRHNQILQGLMLPDGAENTKVVFRHYFVGDAATDPALEADRRREEAEWRLIFEQDIPFVRRVHENYQVRDAAGIETRFAPFWEANVQRFQQTVVETIREGRGP
jgi:choline monooxygenase